MEELSIINKTLDSSQKLLKKVLTREGKGSIMYKLSERKSEASESREA